MRLSLVHSTCNEFLCTRATYDLWKYRKAHCRLACEWEGGLSVVGSPPQPQQLLLHPIYPRGSREGFVLPKYIKLIKAINQPCSIGQGRQPYYADGASHRCPVRPHFPNAMGRRRRYHRHIAGASSASSASEPRTADEDAAAERRYDGTATVRDRTPPRYA